MGSGIQGVRAENKLTAAEPKKLFLGRHGVVICLSE